MSSSALLALYCLAIVAGSLAGGWLPQVLRLTHTRLQVAMSAVAGLMLGVSLLHLLPHAAAELGSLDQAVAFTLVGLLTMFFLVRAFHFHQHGPLEDDDQPAGDACDHEHHDHAHGQGHDHPHDHHPGHHHHHGPSPALEAARHPLRWLGIACGLGLHTLIDGIALAASVQAESQPGHAAGWAGLGTFLAILLHKPLDALSITSLMTAGGWSVGWRQFVNAAFALMCPLGAGLFVLSLLPADSDRGQLVGQALAFAAGAFLCISLGDLLPELQFHTHDRLKLSAALLLGVLAAAAIGLVEGEHVHSHPDHPPHHGDEASSEPR